MENLVEDNGICDCHYLLTMRLALQKEVDSPFGINSIYDLGDWCAPWWRKPVSYADLDAFFESHGCGWLRQSIGIGSWRGVAGEGEKAERITARVLSSMASRSNGHVPVTARGASAKLEIGLRPWLSSPPGARSSTSPRSLTGRWRRCPRRYTTLGARIITSVAWTTSPSWRSTVIWCASRDLMKMGSNRARSSCLRSTWRAYRRNRAALARPTYTA